MADEKIKDERHLLVQTSILTEVLRIVLPIGIATTMLNLFGVLGSTGFSQPGRLILVFISFVILFLSIWQVRASNPHRAMVVLSLGCGVGVSFAVLVNGGLRVPVMGLLLFWVSLCSFSFGRRIGLWVAVWSTIFLSVVYVLQSFSLLRQPPEAPLGAVFVAWSTFVWLVWSSSSIPQEKLREALSQSFAREQELATAQQRTREAHLAFKAIFDQTEHMMSLISPSGDLLSANQPALAFIGFSSDQPLVGRPFEGAPWWVDAERPSLRQAIERAASQREVVRLQLSARDHANQPRTVAFSLSPFRDEAGQLLYLIAESRDVTELMEAKDRQERKHRLDLVGQLAGGVAHDINNVLAAILTSAELLKTDLTGENAELLEIIVGASGRAKDLTRRLLTFARRSPIEKQSLSLLDVVDENLKLLSRTLPPNIKIERRSGDGPYPIVGNSGALSSAILNLSLNAKDAMPNGGALAFSVERVSLSGEWFSSRGEEGKPGEYVCLSVADTGHGIPLHLQPRIFEPFFTTKSEGRGTGLGLASVYGVAHDHNGVVEMSSVEGEGSTFRLYFPLIDEAPTAAMVISSEGSFAGKRALVVDDEPILLRVVSRLLERLGIECVTAPDAEEGLLLFQRDPGSFDLAVLDVVLPGRRGTELAIDLLMASPKLRVVLVSGFQKEADLNSLSSTRIRMLGKPFSSDAMRGALGGLFSTVGIE